MCFNVFSDYQHICCSLFFISGNFYFSLPSKKCDVYPDFLFYLLNLFNFFLYLLTLVIIVVGSLARISVAMENNS